MRIRPLILPLTLCLALALSASAVPDSPAAAAAAAAAAGPGSRANEIETLVRAKSFDRVIARVDELRAAAATRVTDAESEYWGGKASLSLAA